MQDTELRPDDSRRLRIIGVEAGKSLAERSSSGFLQRYLSGQDILDIGYRGAGDNVEAVVPQAIGIDLDYPGYDGRTLPFADKTRDAVFASHCLEHIADFRNALRDWFRVLKIGGFMVVCVPHQFLYEKKALPPSRWNEDHKRFYTPASLLQEIEVSLQPNSYRIRHLIDHDTGYDYSVPPDRHAGGCYEIELVLERIEVPYWSAEKSGTSIFSSGTGRRLTYKCWKGALRASALIPSPIKSFIPGALRSAGLQAIRRLGRR